MNTRTISLAILLSIAGTFSMGCGSNSTGGGGGGGANTNNADNRANKTSTFSIKGGPILPQTIKQGDRQTIGLSVDRGADFHQAVKLETQAPKGLKADLSTKTIGAAEKTDFNLTIEVDKDATPGDQVVKVIVSPETGTSTILDVKVKIEERK